MDSSRVAISRMSTSAQSQSQKKRQQPFCSLDTEKAYVEGLEDGDRDGYRDGLQGGWSPGFDSGYKEAWRHFKERWAALLTTVIIVILVALYYKRLTS